MHPIIDENKSVYLRSDVVSFYGQDELDLQFAEEKIFSEFDSKLPQWNVIDMGVGAGRTSNYLLKKCSQYLGIDYSQAMIDKCRARFKEYPAETFKCADARNLNFIKDASVDFFIFSFNGIDTVSLQDRTIILKEIQRVLKMGGVFVFSSHNLNTDLRKKHALRFSFNPLNLWRSIRRNIQFKIHNSQYEIERKQPQVMLRDGSESFLLKLAYQYPSAQCAELSKNGFSNHRIISNYLKREVSVHEGDTLTEPWVYYLTYKN